MPRIPSGAAAALLASAVLCATPAKADPITTYLIIGAAANTLLKAPFYSTRYDMYGPRYGYPIYGYPGWLRPGYRYAAYDGPGVWPQIDPDAPPAPPTTCYWTNKPEPQGMRRIRICY
ncbi:MAG: hypothetical protein RO009_10900 [Pseudorhodoplanes sp.]|jgi:hypothetical protein|nr:hypothetical protein [Pseudorhodoplanes sp.]